MIVVDTNVLVYLTLVTDHSELAEAVFQRDALWCAPLLWQSEFLNALVMYRRRGFLSRDQAQQAVLEASAVLGERVFSVDPVQVLDLATASGCSAYDCEFVAAQRTSATADRRVFRAFPETAVAHLPVLD